MDDIVPDLVEGMGLGAWMADEENKKEEHPEQEEPIEGSVKSLATRKRTGTARLRPFERHVEETIAEANRGNSKCQSSKRLLKQE